MAKKRKKVWCAKDLVIGEVKMYSSLKALCGGTGLVYVTVKLNRGGSEEKMFHVLRKASNGVYGYEVWRQEVQ